MIGTQMASPRITHVRAEYGGTAVVGTAEPRLSWIIEGADGWLQSAYELRSGDEIVTVESAESVFVPWPLAPLTSRERRELQVRARSTDGRTTEWSEPLVVEAALLAASNWRALFVGPPEAADASPFLRQDFVVDRRVASARLYVTALGTFEPYLNGAVVGDEVLTPSWTSYGHRLRYQTFDVTEQLRPGRNALGAIVGNGWYRGRIARGAYGDELALLAQLEITFEDGQVQVVRTDEMWRTTTGPIIANDIYDGERYDARLELVGWAEPGYDDGAWRPVRVVDHPLETLVAPLDPPIRRIEELPVAAVLESASGNPILDFGQNLVGRLRFHVRGNVGDTITIRHAEAVQDGELVLEPHFFGAKAEDVYVLKGGGVETWEPRFTFHGFRYAEIDGWPDKLDPDSIRALVLHTDFERTGWFDCSNQLVNRLHENAVWTLRGNFLSVPTDCPQRAERLGWCGDAQLFSPAASFLYDVNGPLANWLADLAADQTPEGRMPHYIPNISPLLTSEDALEDVWHSRSQLSSSAGWGDAAAVVPWVLYQRFGDVGLLGRQWESMRRWVDYVAGLAGDNRLWQGTFHFGDWLDPWAPLDCANEGQTPHEVLATAYFARSADIVARAAEVLGREDDARRYARLAAEIRRAFCDEYMDEYGNLDVCSVTAQALLIVFALAQTEEQRQRACERVSQLVRATGYRISTGLLGTPIVCDALCEAGDLDGAYRLLLQTEIPSWLYPVTMGATTIWERWDGILPNGRVNPVLMNSFNHYALGAIVDWLHRTVAGLEAATPGYRKIRFRPQPGGDLTCASARHRTPYGSAAIIWRIDGDELEVEVEVPPNATAEVVLPDGSKPLEIDSGTYRYRARLAPHGVLTNVG
jgi:alpha-L-rhamnosidase